MSLFLGERTEYILKLPKRMTLSMLLSRSVEAGAAGVAGVEVLAPVVLFVCRSCKLLSRYAAPFGIGAS